MNKTTISPAAKRYIGRFMPTMAVYIAAIVFVSLGFAFFRPTGPLAWLLAIVPGMPVLVLIGVMGLYLKEEGDEFVRNLLVESMLWGIGLTMGVLTVWGLLEFYVAAPRLPAFFAFPMFFGFMGLANLFVRRRYQ